MVHCRHVHEEASGQRDVTGDPSALFCHGLFRNLNQDLLPFFQQIANRGLGFALNVAAAPHRPASTPAAESILLTALRPLDSLLKGCGIGRRPKLGAALFFLQFLFTARSRLILIGMLIARIFQIRSFHLFGVILSILTGSKTFHFLAIWMIFGIGWLALIQTETLICVRLTYGFDQLFGVLGVQSLFFEFLVYLFVSVLAEWR